MSYPKGRLDQRLQKLETTLKRRPASGRAVWPSGVPSDDEQRLLTAELQRQLLEVDDSGKTGIQRVVAALIKQAEDEEDPDLKSIQEIFIRIDGDAKRNAEKVELPKPPAVSECHAQKLADAFYDDLSDLPCD
jgi:hypothetical protein